MYPFPPLFSSLMFTGLFMLVGSTGVVLWYIYQIWRHREDVRYFPSVFLVLVFYVIAPLFSNIATVVSLFNPIVEVEISVLFIRGIIATVTALTVVFIYPKVRKIPSAQQLEEEVRLFRTMENISLEGHIRTENGKMVKVNQKACKIYGYTEAELLQLDVTDLIWPEDFAWIMQYREQDHKEKYQCRGKHKDGSVLHLEVRGENTRYHGKLVRITSIKNVTDQVLLLEREKKLVAKLKEDIEKALEQLNAREIEQLTEEKKVEILGLIQDAGKNL